MVEKTGASTISNSVTYAGYEYDKETGLYYLNSRMYEPTTARFLQEDTYTGDRNDPLSLNLYTYCKNEPIMYFDPSGHDPELDKIYGRTTSDDTTKAVVIDFVQSAANGFRQKPVKESFNKPEVKESFSKLEATNEAIEEFIKESTTDFGQKASDSIFGVITDISGAYLVEQLHGYGIVSDNTFNKSKKVVKENMRRRLNEPLLPSDILLRMNQTLIDGWKLPEKAFDKNITEEEFKHHVKSAIATAMIARSAYNVGKSSATNGAGNAEVSAVNKNVGSGGPFGWMADKFRGFRLKQIHGKVVSEVDVAIANADITTLEGLGAGRGEIAAVLRGGSQAAKFRGSIIDTAVKARASNTFGLKVLESPGRFQYGPDFWNPKTMRAWDMTTVKQWQKHITKYITNPAQGRPIWRSLSGLFH